VQPCPVHIVVTIITCLFIIILLCVGTYIFCWLKISLTVCAWRVYIIQRNTCVYRIRVLIYYIQTEADKKYDRGRFIRSENLKTLYYALDLIGGPSAETSELRTAVYIYCNSFFIFSLFIPRVYFFPTVNGSTFFVRSFIYILIHFIFRRFVMDCTAQ